MRTTAKAACLFRGVGPSELCRQSETPRREARLRTPLSLFARVAAPELGLSLPWQPLCPACGAFAPLCAALRRTRTRPSTRLAEGGRRAISLVANFARRTRQRHVLARSEEDLQRRQGLGGARGSWLACRALHDRPALSAVGGAVDLSRHCDRSTGCEVAAEVRHGAQLPPELGFWMCWAFGGRGGPRRADNSPVAGEAAGRVGCERLHVCWSVRCRKRPISRTFACTVRSVGAWCACHPLFQAENRVLLQ